MIAVPNNNNNNNLHLKTDNCDPVSSINRKGLDSADQSHQANTGQ